MKDVAEITKKLEQGVEQMFNSEEFGRYLTFMAKFHNYSVNNCILIWMQKPDATLVAGYKAWQNKFKRQVKKGEKGITILAPCSRKYKKMVEDEDGRQVEREFSYTTFRATSVFDVSQTDGEDLPSICNELDGSVEGYADLIERLEKIAPVPVVFEEIGGGAKGYFREGKIAIRQGMSEAQTVKTMVHEITHAMLHKKGGEQAEADRHEKEVQAESVAYTVCSYLGIDTSEYSFGYVTGWSKGKKAKELTASIEVIRRTASQIIDGIAA